MNVPQLKAPFPWFGGKRRVADIVWRALGPVDNYVEPFAGSLAVLLGRPDEARTETVNDADHFLANFWRALAAAPEEVARWCDWPVNEADLIARHLWLVNSGAARVRGLESDPDFYDAKVAGWWVWGINSWIGSGWCAGKGPWRLGKDGKIEDARQLPHLGTAGQGVNRQLPHLGNAGRGVQSRGDFTSGGAGAPSCSWDQSLCRDGEPMVYGYFRALAARLRTVRVCCGDWKRVLTNGATAYGNTVGVFLDPPYLGDVRTSDLYRVDDHTIAHAVRDWALAHGDDPRFRIVLAGYESEHEAHMPPSWRRFAYSASKAYGTTAAVGKRNGNDANRHLERLWMSPHCLTNGKPANAEMLLAV